MGLNLVILQQLIIKNSIQLRGSERIFLQCPQGNCETICDNPVHYSASKYIYQYALYMYIWFAYTGNTPHKSP